ncbi:MAG TPA: hypothetical protein VLG76_01895 [Rhabdochlamydiaceae bacterium]|nr:hypothetical protein [Rhabdochlamydiaceae bacterium]
MRWIFALLALYAVSRFCHHQTAGFTMAKIQNNTFPLEVNAQTIELKGKFRYFGRGLQSFSFLSEDGKVVLKILNNRYQNRLFWIKFCPFTAWKNKTATVAESKLRRNFNSYRIAYEELKGETGLIYFHPAQTGHLHQTIILIDKLGIEHPLELDDTAFLLQKKATLFYPYIDSLMEKNDLLKAKQALSSFALFLKSRYAKGIADNDALVRTNFGFLDGAPMQIDVGPFYRNDALKEPANGKKELLESTLNLKHWLEAHYPVLASYFNEIIEAD